jgi:hypothetical protein
MDGNLWPFQARPISDLTRYLKHLLNGVGVLLNEARYPGALEISKVGDGTINPAD